MRWHIAVTLGVGTVVGLGCAHPETNAPVVAHEAVKNQPTVPGQYLVTLVPEANVQAIADVYGRFGIKSAQSLGRGVFFVTVADDPGLAKMEELGKQVSRIAAVQPNFVYRLQN